MPKEMIVSCSSHETKIAILEDDQVAEVYFEREKEYTLAGSIYKGRVTRVLPGMQSAFVDVGLERDAFLYVSDFLEDTEEYDRIASTIEEKVIRMEEGTPGVEVKPVVAAAVSQEPATAPAAEMTPPEVAASPEAEASAFEKAPAEAAARAHSGAAQAPPSEELRHRFSRRGRRRRGPHKGFPDSKYATQQPAPPAQRPSPASAPAEPPVILPGESLAKYRSWTTVGPAVESVASSSEEQPQNLASDQFPEEAILVESAQAGVAEPEASSSEDLAQAPVVEGSSMIEERKLEPPAWERVEWQPPLVEEPPEQTEESVQAEQPELETEESEPSSESDLEESSPYFASESDESAVSVESVPESAEVTVSEGEAPKIEAGEARKAEAGMPQKASVRERNRNPRYMRRRGRWSARREPKAETPPRSGSRPREREAPQPLIADLLKEGQEILVQIAKEPLGKKGARITSHIALPGRYLVYMPTVDHVGISRKIVSDEERQRLKRIILEHGKNIPGGFIVRTAGEGHSEEDLRQDIQYLSKLWAEIRLQAEKTPAPALLHHDLNLVLRILRDQLSEDFSSVWVDNEQEYERVLSLVSKFQPTLVNRVKLYSKDVPLFDEMGIQEEINKALKPKVWLKSGGYIVINQTEALVAIDINTGKFVGRSNRLEDTIVKINVEAIKEIVRQIRLRDLGGIIVVDFIDMDEKKNRQKVMAAMEDALKGDRAPSKVLGFNEFGLVAITRKRVRQSLERTLCQPCAYCGGAGLVKSITSVCYEILSEAKKIAPELERKQITLRVNPEVGRALKARDNTILPEIEELTGRPVIVRNDPMLHIENFDFN